MGTSRIYVKRNGFRWGVFQEEEDGIERPVFGCLFWRRMTAVRVASSLRTCWFDGFCYGRRDPKKQST